MSAEILQFPVPLRIEYFIAGEALKQQIRMALGAACGVYHGQLTDEDRMYALGKIEEALVLMRSERELVRI
jgi:hypothetical protein